MRFKARLDVQENIQVNSATKKQKSKKEWNLHTGHYFAVRIWHMPLHHFKQNVQPVL